MRIKSIVTLLAIAATSAWQAGAQNYDTNGDYVQTFAGSGFSGHVDGQGVQTMFDVPSQIVADSSGNLFVWDNGVQGPAGANYNYVRMVTSNAAVTTFAQTPYMANPGMAIDSTGTIWLCPPFTGSLYYITNGFSSSVAIYNSTNFSRINNSGSGICFDSKGNIYISDITRIYRCTTDGAATVFAGSGNVGSVDGTGIFCSFSGPNVLAADSADNIYVADGGGIRRIDQNSNVVTIAGKSASVADGQGTNTGFSNVGQMAFDGSGNLILACGNCIRMISPTTNVTTLAGSFTQTGYTNGPGNLARFNGASGVCVSGGTIFVADASNQRIRSITNNPQPQVVSGANLGIGTYAGLTITGVVGRTYQIQTSPDTTNWTTHATLLLTSSPYLWIDQNPVSANKFYRALLLP